MNLTPGVREKHAEMLRRLNSRKRISDEGIAGQHDGSNYQQALHESYYNESDHSNFLGAASGPSASDAQAPMLQSCGRATRGACGSGSSQGLTTPNSMPPPQGYGTHSNNSAPQHGTRSSASAPFSVSEASPNSSVSPGAQAAPVHLPPLTYLFPIDGSGISKSLFACSTNNLLDLVALLGFELGETRKKPSKTHLQLFLIRLHGDPSTIYFDDNRGWLLSGTDAFPDFPTNCANFNEAFPLSLPLAVVPPAVASDADASPFGEGTAEPTAAPLNQLAT